MSRKDDVDTARLALFDAAWARRAGRGALIAAPVGLLAYSLVYASSNATLVTPQFGWLIDAIAYTAAAAALYGSKRFPLLAVLVGALCWWVTGSALFVIVGSLLLGARQPRWWIPAIIGLGILHPVSLVPDPLSYATGQNLLWEWTIPLTSSVVPALVGIAIRSYRDSMRRREEDLARARQEAEAQARNAVEQDRMRMSREMHDILGHQLSTIVLMSTALVASQGKDAERLAARIADKGHTAIEDLRYVLRVLDAPGDNSDAQLTGAALVRHAIAEAEQSGVTVTTDSDFNTLCSNDEAGDLLTDTLVEAVRNAVKYAPGCTVRITTEVILRRVRLLIVNNAMCAETPAGPLGTGNGLRRLAARAAELGGSLTTTDALLHHDRFRVLLDLTR